MDTHMIIADIAGQSEALRRLLTHRPSEECKVIFVGDLVDRGPDSKGVIEIAMSTPNSVALMGNHEHMMTTFLRCRERKAGYSPNDWFRNGGFQTLESYGATKEEVRELNGKTWAPYLKALVSEEILQWLEALPLSYETEGLFVSHAPWMADGGDFDREDIYSLIWNRAGPWKKEGVYQVYGHNSHMPGIKEDSACIDYSRSGQLTAMLWPSKTVIHQRFAPEDKE